MTGKAIGTTFETNIVKYFIECGFKDCRRVVLHGSNDESDIHLGEPNNPYFTIECKSRKIEAPYKMVEDFVKESHIEYKNATKSDSVKYARALTIVKRPNLGTQDSWLIWKNNFGITLRCRLGDIVNKENFSDEFNTFASYQEKLVKLEKYIGSSSY